MKTRHNASVLSAFLLAVCFLILTPHQGVAAAGNQKIGFVDMDAVSKKCTVVAGIREKVEKTASDKRASIETKMTELDRLTLELKRKESVLSDTEVASMKEKIRSLRNSISDEDDKINEMLQKAKKEQLDPAFDKIIETIRVIGGEEGFDIILPGEVVLYGAPSTDITEKVIARMNSQSAAAAPASEKSDSAKAAAATDGAGTPEKKAAPMKKSLFRKTK